MANPQIGDQVTVIEWPSGMHRPGVVTDIYERSTWNEHGKVWFTVYAIDTEMPQGRIRERRLVRQGFAYPAIEDEYEDEYEDDSDYDSDSDSD